MLGSTYVIPLYHVILYRHPQHLRLCEDVITLSFGLWRLTCQAFSRFRVHGRQNLGFAPKSLK